MINAVNTNHGIAQSYNNSKKTNSPGSTQAALASEEAAVLELGNSVKSSPVTYEKPSGVNVLAGNTPTAETQEKKSNIEETNPQETRSKEINAEEINRLWEEANRATQHLRDLVAELLKSQGKTFEDVLSGKEELVVDEKTRAAAAEAISENGECGVQAVSDRIVAFAKAISNDNPEMYDKLMSAIDEGFAQAEKAFGGQLPEICQKTREEIGRKMEEWKNGSVEE